LEGHRFDGRAGHVSRGCAAGEAEDRAAGVGIPVRSAEADEGGYDDDTVGGGHGASEVFDINRGFDDAEAVAEPLHDGTRDENGPFEAIRGFAAELPADRGEQLVL